MVGALPRSRSRLGTIDYEADQFLGSEESEIHVVPLARKHDQADIRSVSHRMEALHKGPGVGFEWNDGVDIPMDQQGRNSCLGDPPRVGHGIQGAVGARS